MEEAASEELWSPEGRFTVWLLNVSWFREVGNESHHHSDVHPGAYSDGEGGEEQRPPGGDVGQREVSFVHRLGGLEKKEGRRRKVRRRRKSQIFTCSLFLWQQEKQKRSLGVYGNKKRNEVKSDVAAEQHGSFNSLTRL